MQEKLNLNIFDGASAAPAASAPAPGQGTEQGNVSQVSEDAEKRELPQENSGAQTQVTANTLEKRRADFEKLIRGEYKDIYDERAQRMIDERFKKTKALEEQSAAIRPVLDLLAGKYGVDPTDVQALSKAIQDDDSYYQDEAMEKGITVEQLKEFKRLERENAQFRRESEEKQRQENAQRIYAQWTQQAEECKRFYPQFDLRAEINGPDGERLMRLLRAGVDVRTSYEIIHKDELIGSAMQLTARTVAEKTVNDIKARGMRPSENGASSQTPGITTKLDPKKLTKKEREEISKRVMRGEKITF